MSVRDFNNFPFSNTVPQSTHVADHVLPPHRHPLVDTHDAVTASPREQYKIHYTHFLCGNRIRGVVSMIWTSGEYAFAYYLFLGLNNTQLGALVVKGGSGGASAAPHAARLCSVFVDV